jgi:hypothetical protein
MLKIPYLFIWVLILTSMQCTLAQDMLYLADETFQQGRVLKKETDVISFKSISGTGNVSVKKKEVLMIIYEGGNFEVYPDAATKSIPSSEITSTVSSRTSDWIVTSDRIIYAKISDAATKKIAYVPVSASGSPSETIDKSQVMAVFYKNGKYAFYSSPSTVANALWRMLSKTDKKSISAAEPLKNSTQVPTQQKSVSIKKDTNDSIPFNSEELLKRAKENTTLLEQYIGIIADKETENEVADKAIDKSVKLFVQDAQIQVSRLGTDEKLSYPIHTYLKRLRILEYDRVEIIWHNIYYISTLRKSGDKYYGTISYEQEFRGYKEGVLKYVDNTDKNMEVVVQPYEKRGSDGQVQQKWEVFFGDISVMVTRK